MSVTMKFETWKALPLAVAEADADAAREDASRFAKHAAAATMKAAGTTPTKEPKPSDDDAENQEELAKARSEATAYREKFAKAVKKGKGIALELDGANKELDAVKQRLNDALR